MRAYKHWLPVALWMGIIFAMSSNLGSSSNTSRILEPLLFWMKPHATRAQFEAIHFIVRKLAHLSEYAVLSLLILRALNRSHRLAPGWFSWRTAGTAQLISSAYAVTDEWHQSFVPGRTAAFSDVLIDSSGALVGLAFVFLWSAVLRPRSPTTT